MGEVGAVTDLSRLMSRTRELASSGRRVLLGIAGPPGAGKSTLAETLVHELGSHQAVLVPMDGFHIGDAELRRQGMRGRKGASDTFDRDGFASALARIRAGGRDVYLPVFDRGIEDSIAADRRVGPDVPLVVVEGNYLLLWPEVRALLDECWYVDPPAADRHAALIARHIAFGKSVEEATRWSLESDERNAVQIAAGRDLADLIVGWAM